MIILMTVLIAGASMAFAVHQWWRGYHLDSDRLHYFRMPNCGRCHRSREEQPKRGSRSGSPVTIKSAARNSNPARDALKDAARTLGLDLLFFNASTPKEIDAAFAAFAREKRYGGKTYPT